MRGRRGRRGPNDLALTLALALALAPTLTHPSPPVPAAPSRLAAGGVGEDMVEHQVSCTQHQRCNHARALALAPALNHPRGLGRVEMGLGSGRLAAGRVGDEMV